MAIQPELKVIQRKFKGDREGLARAQMGLYKERGINPAAGCLPLLIQMPILFGMYAAMNQLATQGITLDQVSQSENQPGQVVYAAKRDSDPLPFNQFVLARMNVVPTASTPITIDVQQDQSAVSHQGQPLLSAVGSVTLTPGSAPGNPNPPGSNTTTSIFLRAGEYDNNGILERNRPVTTGQPMTLEIWVNTAGVNVDSAKAVLSYDSSQLQVLTDCSTADSNTLASVSGTCSDGIYPPKLDDLAFKSQFLWLPSLGQPDVVHIPGVPFSIPGLLLIIMTITSFVSQRMTTMPTEDPQQQAMMKSMAFMPLMYLFFFVNTPAGLVLYWLASNVFSAFQQYFTVGLGLLGGDLLRITGRNLQPPWSVARLQASTAAATVAALAAGDSTNGSSNNNNHSDGRPPGAGTSVTGTTRRPRPGPSKGRKRGKR